MTFSSTKDFTQAHKWASSSIQFREPFETYCPRSNFVEAYFDGESFSFGVSEENGGLYVMGLGPHPYIPDAWTSASISRGSDALLREDAQKEVDWDFYAIDTAAFSQQEKALEVDDAGEISKFLRKHAPSSSVFPGDPEIIFWAGVRSARGKLLSIGAVVRWRTGKVMFASIATDKKYRGKGLAQKMMVSALRSLHDLGIGRVGLGVLADNEFAKKAYEKVGFTVVSPFTAYSKV